MPLRLNDKGIASLISFAVVSFLLILIGDFFYFGDENVSTFWPLSGFVIAFLYTRPVSKWPAILVTLGVVQFSSEVLIAGQTPLSALAFLIPISVEALIAAYFLRRTCGFPFEYWQGKSLIGFIVGAVFAATMIGALAGAAIVKFFAADADFWTAWEIWWFGNALGVLLAFPPALLLLSRDFKKEPPVISTQSMIEFAIWSAVLLVITALSIDSTLHPTSGFLLHPIMAFPLFVWAAIRFGLLFNSILLLITAVVLVAITDAGLGPFLLDRAPPREIVLTIQSFLFATALTTLTLSVQVEQRNRQAQARQVAEAHLRVSNEKLRQAQKMEAIGLLAGGLAHDFNNLLSIALGNLELLENIDESEENAQFIAAATTALHRGADITRDMLGFARRADLDPEELDLNQVLRETQGWSARAFPRNIEIVTELADDLCLVEVDAGSTQNALLNLMLNARDAMPEGGKLHLTTRNRRIAEKTHFSDHLDLDPGDYVMLSVSDTGEGIAESKLPRIFEPYFTSKEAGKGTGLGLSMVYGFMEQSGGAVTVESKVDTGTTFHLFFKALEEAAVDVRRSA